MNRVSGYIRSYNGQVLLRIIAAFLIGYLASNSIGVVLAKSLHRFAGISQPEAALYASLSAFLIYSVIILWAFSVRSQKKLWQGLTLLTLTLSGVAFLL